MATYKLYLFELVDRIKGIFDKMKGRYTHMKNKMIVIILCISMLFSASVFYNDTQTKALDAVPVFSKESGSYKDAFKLEITAVNSAKIFYTLDGSDVFVNGEISDKAIEYVDGIDVHDRQGEPNVLCNEENSHRIDHKYGNAGYVPKDSDVKKCTVVKAALQFEDKTVSPTITKVYFVGSNQAQDYKIPVVSLVTDSSNLFDEEKGIMVSGKHNNFEQSGQDWERVAAMTFFDAGGNLIKEATTDVGIRIHGGYSRNMPQKSLNINLREEYGQKNIKYELIPGEKNKDGSATNKYKKLMLHNGGNDAMYTKFHDVFLQSLVSGVESLDTQASTPCVLYLNGEYWGLYNLKDRFSDNWVEEHYGIDKENVIVIKNGEVEDGQPDDINKFYEMGKFMDYPNGNYKPAQKVDMTDEKLYKKFEEEFDVQSFSDYLAFEMLIGNSDWNRCQNNSCWRVRDTGSGKYEDGKWRWLVFDTEYSMGLYGEDVYANNSDGISFLKNEEPVFENAWDNPKFKKIFAKSVKRLLDNELNYEKNKPYFDKLTEEYREYNKENLLRWGSSQHVATFEIFDKEVARMESFWEKMEKRAYDTFEKYGIDLSDIDRVDPTPTLEPTATPEPTATLAPSPTPYQTITPAPTKTPQYSPIPSQPSSLENSDKKASATEIKAVKMKLKKVSGIKAKRKKNKIILSWKKQKYATGYVIKYAKKKNFKSCKTDYTKANKKSYASVGFLKKKCYFKIAAYKNLKGKKVIGKYTKLTLKKK